MFLANFILGIITIGIGVLMLKFNFKLTNSFGRNNAFERNLGPGASYLMYQVIAMIVIFFGFLLAFSLHDNFTRWVLSPLESIFTL